MQIRTLLRRNIVTLLQKESIYLGQEYYEIQKLTSIKF